MNSIFTHKPPKALGATGVGLALSLSVATAAPAVMAQDIEAAEGHPAAVHSGSCEDMVAEPAYDIGVMEQTAVGAPGEQLAGVLDDGIVDNTDKGFVREDIDDDDVFEIGIDEDDDAELDEDEALGADEDDSGFLEEDEVSVAEADTSFPTDFGPVYTVDTDVEFDGSELIDEGPYVVAVHESAEAYDTVVACGPVLPIIEDGNVIVPLQPQDDSGYDSVFLINEGDGEVAGFAWPTNSGQ